MESNLNMNEYYVVINYICQSSRNANMQDAHRMVRIIQKVPVAFKFDCVMKVLVDQLNTVDDEDNPQDANLVIIFKDGTSIRTKFDCEFYTDFMKLIRCDLSEIKLESN